MNEPRRQFGSVAQTGSVAIDQGLRQYMLGVYNYMALAVAGTGFMSMFIASNPSLVQQIALSPLKWVAFAGVLGLGWFAPRVIFNGSKAMAHGMFWAYAALWGVLIAPMLFYFQQS
ncbi:MAG: Bax inhibitor-1/YccA family protein, partial [Hyphococcus sp.]